LLYDLDTAGRAGTQSTGHGPGCSPTNLVMAPGDVSYEEMLTDTKEGLLVHDVLGLGQGNAISGEFSVNVQLAYKIENGEIAGRVKDVMLAGNTYDAIKNIDAIGDTPIWRNGFGGMCQVPYVKVGSLSVVAK
jgi:PmbA protein